MRRYRAVFGESSIEIQIQGRPLGPGETVYEGAASLVDPDAVRVITSESGEPIQLPASSEPAALGRIVGYLERRFGVRRGELRAIGPEAPGGRIDERAADALYSPFPPLELWATAFIDVERWKAELEQRPAAGSVDSEVLRRALAVVKRAAALDTGAIEGLYETDRGITFTVARELASWEAVLEAQGPGVRDYFQAQLEAYEQVIDFATGRQPLAEVWIRELHAQVCASQQTYWVQTSVGPQKQPLPRGRYKSHPNHVLLPDGSVHAYAPVDLVPAEMARLVEVLRSSAFVAAHPIVQAAYAHYALVVVHPFADGNGRVARALGSVFTARAVSVPLLILADTRDSYLKALRSADAGEPQEFVQFVFDRTVEALQIVAESVRAAGVPSAGEAQSRIRRLFRSRGGYTHAEVDAAAYRLAEVLHEAADQLASELSVRDQIQVSIDRVGATPNLLPDYRQLIQHGSTAVRLTFRTAAPAEAALSRVLTLQVPRDPDVSSEVVVRVAEDEDTLLRVRAGDLSPQVSSGANLRSRIFVETVISVALGQLHELAERALRRQGY